MLIKNKLIKLRARTTISTLIGKIFKEIKEKFSKTIKLIIQKPTVEFL